MQRAGQYRNIAYPTVKLLLAQNYMVLIWDLHGLDRISMGFLSSYTAMRLVPGAAKVPQHVVEEANCVQNLGLGYIEVDQQTEGRLKILVLFNIGLAYVAAPLLVHRQVVQAILYFIVYIRVLCRRCGG